MRISFAICVNRAMESENHRYMPIGTSRPEGQHVDSKGPCRSGSNGDCCETSKSDGQQAHGNEDGLMKDTFYLEHVGQVTVRLSDTHFRWSSVEDHLQELVTILTLCVVFYLIRFLCWHLRVFRFTTVVSIIILLSRRHCL